MMESPMPTPNGTTIVAFRRVPKCARLYCGWVFDFTIKRHDARGSRGRALKPFGDQEQSQ